MTLQRVGLGDFPQRIKAKLARRKPFAMFDSVTVSEIPADAPAVAGYVNGRWPTFPDLARTHPHARRLSIAVNASADADCLDVESGDATPDQAPAWVRRQLHRGVRQPRIYCSVSAVAQVVGELHLAGIRWRRVGLRPRQVRIWTAHYTGRPHLCGPGCGFGMPIHADATQWTDKALGRNLDESLCAPRFL